MTLLHSCEEWHYKIPEIVTDPPSNKFYLPNLLTTKLLQGVEKEPIPKGKGWRHISTLKPRTHVLAYFLVVQITTAFKKLYGNVISRWASMVEQKGLRYLTPTRTRSVGPWAPNTRSLSSAREEDLHSWQQQWPRFQGRCPQLCTLLLPPATRPTSGLPLVWAGTHRSPHARPAPPRLPGQPPHGSSWEGCAWPASASFWESHPSR